MKLKVEKSEAREVRMKIVECLHRNNGISWGKNRSRGLKKKVSDHEKTGIFVFLYSGIEHRPRIFGAFRRTIIQVFKRLLSAFRYSVQMTIP